MIEPCSLVVPPVALAAQGASDQPKPLILRPHHFRRWGKSQMLSQSIAAAVAAGIPVVMVSEDATQADITQALADLGEDRATHKRLLEIKPFPTPPDISPAAFPRESAYDRRNRGAPFYRNIKRRKR